jgi:DNA-binding PadR family transcriptional regulator
MPDRPIRDDLPLTPLSHAILLALADGDRHGYGIIKEVERQTDRALSPGTGTLYAALHRMADEGLIQESDRLPEPHEDQRRKYYRLTPAGRALVRAETLRLARLVALAREKDLVTEGEAAVEGGG